MLDIIFRKLLIENKKKESLKQRPTKKTNFLTIMHI